MKRFLDRARRIIGRAPRFIVVFVWTVVRTVIRIAWDIVTSLFPVIVTMAIVLLLAFALATFITSTVSLQKMDIIGLMAASAVGGAAIWEVLRRVYKRAFSE